MLSVLLAGACLAAGPAAAQGFDPTAQRLEMERLRARTEINAANAAAFRAQGVTASQQLQATSRNDGGVGAAVAADAAVRAQALSEQELRRRQAEEARLDLERRLRTLPPPAPR